jgi:poly-gamma-glutamate synthesis protein (capsule biosynthesis protein)
MLALLEYFYGMDMENKGWFERYPDGMKNNGAFRVASLLLALLLLCGSCLAGCAWQGQSVPDSPVPSPGVPADAGGTGGAVRPEPVSARLLFAGDVMVHVPQLNAARTGSGSYDFSGSYSYVKKYIRRADLALCNLETTLGGEPYTGYPTFSAPDSLADALAGAGFDALFTSNNHMLDRGLAGLKRTIRVTRKAGLANVGTQRRGEPGYLLASAGALTVGIVSYTYESPRSGGRRTLNGIPFPDGAEALLNSFGFEELEDDIGRMEATVRSARAEADIVVCYFHWGSEYQREPDDSQRRIAERMAGAGADLIVASHPHVLQEAQTLTVGSRKVPVYYSMGNYISNQRAETVGNRYTEQGAMVVADVSAVPGAGAGAGTDAGAGAGVSVRTKVIPTWVDKYAKDGRNVFAIIPLVGDFEDNAALRASGHVERAKQARRDAEALFGKKRIYLP